ncbi:MAG: cell division protein FtsZ [Candidatus Accumulibacter sp.]|nr:cell division protein FtsZ [Accumulibacter sp.]
MFEIIDKEEPVADFETVIKVIGVGGAGGNAVDHMIREGVMGVEFIAANTDAQALRRSVAPKKLRLGKSGLGAGARPEVGRDAALSERDQIEEALRGAHMVFITAGMGGGTGTGAAPVVAEIARGLGVLTVAVVTKPFAFEGKRARIAEAGITELQKHVDSLIIVLNEKLVDVLGKDISMAEAFEAANNVLRNAVGGIAEIINSPGLINVDFEDVKTVMGEMGMAMMGSAFAAGVDRARIAAEQAVASPLLEGVNLSGAKGVLVNITATHSLKLTEVHEVMDTVRKFAAEDAHIIFGAVYDDDMEDEMRVTVVATGLGQPQAKRQPFEVIHTPVMQGTGTDGAYAHGTVDYKTLDIPAVIRQGVLRKTTVVEALANSGVDTYDIPAFLRKQAD